MNTTRPKFIIGLGNIGDNYVGTRHNIGFAVLDALVKKQNGSWHMKARFNAVISELSLNGHKVILAKPTTFYNLSGEAVQAIAAFYKINLGELLVAHDELDLPLGMLRTRLGGSDAGNNGIKDINARCGSNFARIRIGIANEQLQTSDAADFVLRHFTLDEQQLLPQIIDEALRFIEIFATSEASLPTTSIRLP